MTQLLVASSGGHIEELKVLAPILGIAPDDALWVTSRTPQTECLLGGEEVVWIPQVSSGDLTGAARSLPAALRLHRRVRPDRVISTGAAAAAPHLIAARLSRCPVWYVESAARLHGPSKTGRLAQGLPGATLFAQGKGWGDPRWRPLPDVFHAFDVEQRVGPTAELRSAVVSLGTERFPFRRAVEASERVLGDCSVTWQTGSTVVVRDGHTLSSWVRADKLRRTFREADVVITHGGVGSVLVALSEGKVPVLLPRRHDKGEHIDNHQAEVCQMLQERGLAVSVDPDELSVEHLRRAQSLQVVPAKNSPFLGR